MPAEDVSARPALAARTTVALEPIAEDRHLLRATVTDAFRADLEAVRAALSHQLPGGALGDVLHHCLRVTLAACEKRRRGSGRAVAGELVADSRYLPAALRDAVWRRDEGRCAFVTADGRRCDSTWQLEIHHVVPFARAATATLDGLALRCRAHNQQQARQDFGEAEVERAIAARQGRLC